MEIKTYVVIPHYIVNDELRELATNAIASYRKASPDAIIISVDDGSTADTMFLKELSDYYICNEKNSGFAITCNNGFLKAFELIKESGDDDAYLVCSNNDLEVYAGWDKAMKDPFKRWDNVAITGLISFKGKIIEGNIPIEKYQLRVITDGGLLRGWMQSGGLWMSTKTVLDKIGIVDNRGILVFDEQFERGGFEDIDLFLRARDLWGMRIIMSGFSAFWHKEGATRWGIDLGGFNLESKGYESRNEKKFFAKWGNKYINRQIWYEKELHNG